MTAPPAPPLPRPAPSALDEATEAFDRAVVALCAAHAGLSPARRTAVLRWAIYRLDEAVPPETDHDRR